MTTTGVDLNPLAVILARVKTTPLSVPAIRLEHQAILRRFDDTPTAPVNVDIQSIGFW